MTATVGPIIAYDVFAAAQFYLCTGRTLDGVLPLLGLTPSQWAPLNTAYDRLALWEWGYQDYFEGADDAAIMAMILGPRWTLTEPDEVSLRSCARHIRAAVIGNPRIGPFEHVDWIAEHIADHAEASLVYYSHDGNRVYFNGAPLIDKAGAVIHPDPTSLEWIGGRWLRDATHVYGQGQHGGRNPKPYWFTIADADRRSFEVLNLRYAKDIHRAYYITDKTIRTKSPKAFEIIPEVRLNFRDGLIEPLVDTSVFARDNEYVYFYGVRLRGANPLGFADLGHGYATDGQTVWFYYDKRLIDGADAATFRVPGPGEPYPGRGLVCDRFRVYRDGGAVDPAEHVEQWRPFFEGHPELDDWWWHRVQSGHR